MRSISVVLLFAAGVLSAAAQEFPQAEISNGTLDEIGALAPFGQGNPRPLARVGPLRLVAQPRLFGRGHLAAEAVSEDGSRLSLVGWGWEDRRSRLDGRFEALGAIEKDSYSGRPTVRLVDARPI